MSPKVIAFYLPQFHPVPDNDKFWGPGFTEWTNLAKARPLFENHDQPKIPGELGFYDLRLAETRKQQSDLALAYGVTGFCYWHYWFGGKRVLERPFNEVLELGQPAIPFCLGWANESWTGIWHGSPGRMLLEQTYPGDEDVQNHFAFLDKAFKDPRYIRINGRPLLTIYKPLQLPDSATYLRKFRNLAEKAGYPGLHILGVNHLDFDDPKKLGLDGAILSSFGYVAKSKAVNQIVRKFWGLRRRMPIKSLRIVDYDSVAEFLLPPELESADNFPCILPNWDNTPRSGERGVVLVNTSVQKFEELVRKAKKIAMKKKSGEELIFVKSWNEWAEGNYLEPDFKGQRALLESLKRGLA